MRVLRAYGFTVMFETDQQIPQPSGARERILATAYELFTHRAIRDVGVDELIQTAGVANATFYRHFHSKDELVLAVLERREQLFTLGTVEQEARRRGESPRERLLAIFDIYDDWFHRDDYEACSFVHVLLEMGPTHPLGQASVEHLARIRSIVKQFAIEAGLFAVEEFTRAWHILMKGSIVLAAEGDKNAAKVARDMAGMLIDRHSSPLPGH